LTHIVVLGGWGARIRTWEWRNQNPLPYHLATPHRGICRAAGGGCLPAARDHSGAVTVDQRNQLPIAVDFCGDFRYICRAAAAAADSAAETPG
jgi:hypothetical protein